MDRQREKRLPPRPSGDRETSGVAGRSMSGNPPPLPSDPANRGHLASPLGSGTYSHPRAAPAPPATSSTAAYSPTVSSFPLSSPPGLNDCSQPHPHSDPQPQPQTRRPLRPAPWRMPTSPQRPPPGRLFDRALLSATPQRPAQKTSRSGSLPTVNYSKPLVEDQSLRSPRPVTPHPSHGVRSPPSQYARSAIPPVPPAPVTVSPAAAETVGFQLHQRQLSSTFSPPIPEKSPRRSVVDKNRKERRRESTNSTYSQGSIYAETYHGFMFGDHGNGQGSQKYADGIGRKGENRNRELSQIFSPITTARTPSPPLESHYRRPTPIRTITATRIIRKPATLRPLNTQQDLRTPSPLSATLKGPGPHVPDGHQWEISPAASTNDASAAGGASHAAPVFARQLTASPEVMSFVAAEEDDRRGMVSRWSTDSSDLSDSSDEEAVDMYSVSPTREVGREAGQESAQKPSEEYHEVQEVAQETSSARDSTTSRSRSRSSSDPSPASQEHKRTEAQHSEDPTLRFNNLTCQLAALEASLNHLVSYARDLDTAFGQVRDAMMALREKATETLVDTHQFLEEVKGVEGQLAEVRRRAMKGKGKVKEKESVGSSDGNQDRRRGEDKGQGEENDSDKGHEKEQDGKREARREDQQRPQEGPPKPRRGPPSGPAPGGAGWV